MPGQTKQSLQRIVGPARQARLRDAFQRMTDAERRDLLEVAVAAVEKIAAAARARPRRRRPPPRGLGR